MWQQGEKKAKSLRSVVDAIFAVRKEWPSTKVLLDGDADIEAEDKYGQRALHFAAIDGRIEVVKVRRRRNLRCP